MKEHIPNIAIGGTVGLVIYALLQTGLFATKGDLAQLETRVAMNYATKVELRDSVDEIKELIKELKISLAK